MYCTHKLGIRLASIAPTIASLTQLNKLPVLQATGSWVGGLGTRLHLLPVLERYNGFTISKVSFTMIR